MRYLITFLMFIVFVAVHTAQGRAVPPFFYSLGFPSDHLNKLFRAIESGNTEEAIIHLTADIKYKRARRDTDPSWLHFALRGDLYNTALKPKLALQDLNEALRLLNSSKYKRMYRRKKRVSRAMVMSERALAFAYSGNFERAYADLKVALEVQPGWPPYRNTLAEIYKLEGRIGDALIELNAGIEARPDYQGYYLERGQLYEKLGKFELANSDYKRLCKSSNVMAHSGLKRIKKISGSLRRKMMISIYAVAT